jgi:predicted patatin/cPLA2 family phospholipase
MTRREFIDLRRFFSGRSIVDLDWLWATLAEKEPLDVAAIAASTTEFVVAATSVATGEPAYFEKRDGDLFDLLRGSCALPVMYRGSVQVGGDSLVDGGVSDPIPVEEAYRRGARRMLVVRSRPAGYVKTNGLGTRFTARLLRETPAVARSVLATAERYQRAVRFLHAPPSDCRIVHVAPDAPLATGRTTQDPRRLQQDYDLGRTLGADAMRRWEALG